MLITPASLDALFTNYNVKFNQGLDAITPVWPAIATEIPSESEIETYAWEDICPAMREFLGEKVVQNAVARTYTLPNKNWEVTKGLSKFKIADDTFGLFGLTVQNMALAAKKQPDIMVAAAIEANGLCFDGLSFFNAAHPLDPSDPASTTQSNLFNTANGGTKPLNSANLIAVRAAMRKIKGRDGQVFGIDPTVLLVPTALADTALQLVNSELIAPTSALGGGGAASTVQSNPLRGAFKVVVCPYLTSDTAWYLLDDRQAVKPFIFQNRQAPTFMALADDLNPHTFVKSEYLYSVEMRGAAGYGQWFLCVKADV